MKIALVGYGQMGKMVEQIAGSHHVEVAERFDVDHFMKEDEATRQSLRDVPVLVEFTLPETSPENIRIGTALGKSMVIGTTGWHQKLDEVRAMVRDGGTGLVYGNNFSLGVNLFYRMVSHASSIMARFDSYDPFIEEAHHRFKKDAPSGTGLTLNRIMKKNYSRDIPTTSVRAGYIPGTHAVGFDSQVDTIQLKHTARSRGGFAEGALLAAKWVRNKQGVFEFGEVIEDLLST